MGIKAVVGKSRDTYDLCKRLSVLTSVQFRCMPQKYHLLISEVRLYTIFLVGHLLIITIPGSLVMNWQLFVAFGIFLYFYLP